VFIKGTLLSMHYILHIIGLYRNLISKGQPWPSSSDSESTTAEDRPVLRYSL